MQQIDLRKVPTNISMAVSEAQAKYTIHVEAFLIHYREYPGGGICTQFIRANSEPEALRLAKEYIPRGAIVERITHCNHARNAIYQGYLREQDMVRERKRKADLRDAMRKESMRAMLRANSEIKPEATIKPKTAKKKTSKKLRECKRAYNAKARARARAEQGGNTDGYLTAHLDDTIHHMSRCLTVREWMRYYKLSRTVVRMRLSSGSKLASAVTSSYPLHNFAEQPLLGKIVADLKAGVLLKDIMKEYHINNQALSIIREYYV